MQKVLSLILILMQTTCWAGPSLAVCLDDRAELAIKLQCEGHSHNCGYVLATPAETATPASPAVRHKRTPGHVASTLTSRRQCGAGRHSCCSRTENSREKSHPPSGRNDADSIRTSDNPSTSRAQSRSPSDDAGCRHLPLMMRQSPVMTGNGIGLSTGDLLPLLALELLPPAFAVIVEPLRVASCTEPFASGDGSLLSRATVVLRR